MVDRIAQSQAIGKLCGEHASADVDGLFSDLSPLEEDWNRLEDEMGKVSSEEIQSFIKAYAEVLKYHDWYKPWIPEY